MEEIILRHKPLFILNLTLNSLVCRYFRDPTRLRYRKEDIPGPDMVTDPRQLPHLSKDDKT